MITLREKTYGKQFCSFDPVTMGLMMGGSSALQMGGTIFGGLFGSSSEKKRAAAIQAAGQQAASDITAATNAGVDFGKRNLRTARADLAPFKDMGATAGNTLLSLLTGGSSLSGTLKGSDLFNFESELGSRNINRELAARGMYGSGAGLETLARFNNQLVGEEGQRLVDRLFNLTGVGANAASNMASVTGNMGSSLANMIYGGGVQAAQMKYNSAIGAADARSNANQMIGNMGQKLFGQAGDGLMQYGNFMMQKPVYDQNMKLTDAYIKKMGMTE